MTTATASRFAAVTVEPGVRSSYPLGHADASCSMALGPRIDEALLADDPIWSEPWPCPTCIPSRQLGERTAAPASASAVTFVPERTVARVATVKPNKYAGACVRCGQHVAAEAGQLAGKVDGRWTVRHLDDACPEKAAAPPAPKVDRGPMPDVAAGRYAVDTEDGHLAFYVVDRPGEGRWAGYTFLSVQASDEKHPIRGGAARTILAKIAVDPHAAMLRYGRELGRCGHCGRTLTDEDSRAAGIGPVCAAMVGV